MFRELILKYYDDIFRFCYYKTKHEQAAYDCTQDTFLHLTKYIHTYVEKRKFKEYLFTLARNACHDYFRKNSQNLEEWNWEEAEMSGMAANSPDLVIQEVEWKDTIGQALQKLPMMQREAVVLHYLYDFKLREIAKMTNVSLPTAKSRLRQGLLKLRSMMEE